MGKLTRAAWRGKETALLNAYDRVERAHGGDQNHPQVQAAYQRVKDHHDDRGVVDAVADTVREHRGSWRVAGGKSRWTD